MKRIWTVGHSTRPIEEFVALLQAHSIEFVADVRTVPRSHRNPQFNRDSLPAMLSCAGIAYRHMPGLGGLRKPKNDSVNRGWENASFRGYADYMQTDEFERSLAGLMDAAAHRRTAIMCAEAVPWRCHRSLIGDALSACGWEVEDILTAERAQPHRMTPFARVEGVRVTYPPEQVSLPFHNEGRG